MKKKMLVLIGVISFTLFLINGAAGAASVRFPFEMSIDSNAHYLIDTEIFVINLKNTPVSISFGLYSHDGVKGSCPIPPSITIKANGAWSFRVGGCFAVAIPMPPVDVVGIGEISASSKSVSVYWRIYDVSETPYVLLDHGKESP
jgi:hypothetical protein